MPLMVVWIWFEPFCALIEILLYIDELLNFSEKLTFRSLDFTLKYFGLAIVPRKWEGLNDSTSHIKDVVLRTDMQIIRNIYEAKCRKS